MSDEYDFDHEDEEDDEYCDDEDDDDDGDDADDDDGDEFEGVCVNACCMVWPHLWTKSKDLESLSLSHLCGYEGSLSLISWERLNSRFVGCGAVLSRVLFFSK